jgi:cell division septum initiation protein DivIVA
MKTFLKIFGFIILILFLIVLIFPYLIKDKIGEVAKEEINKNVKATINFEDLSLSMFHNFPNLRLGLNELSVTGKDEFEGDTLAKIGSIEVVINLMSAIAGDSYQINRISIIKPDFKIKVLEDGKSNYDIAIEEEPPTSQESEATSSGFSLILKKFEIVDGIIHYQDIAYGIDLALNGLNHTLMGNFTADQTRMQTLTEIEQFNFSYEGIKYFSDTKVKYIAAFDADLKNEIYTLNKNELKLNELVISFEGSVSMINEEDINLIMTFNAPKTDFKNLLSLVPAVYAKDFETIQTKGELSLNGHVKGIYNEESLPAFALNLKVNDAMFKYPDLPGTVEKINIDAKVSNPGGEVDNTIVDISRFNLSMANNPVKMKLLLKTPESDPDIDGMIAGKLDLASIKTFYPLEEGEDLSGQMQLDITLKGKMSAIEEERYEEFTALGSLLLSNLNYKSSSLNEKIEIQNAQLNFSPAYLDLVSFKTKIGNNDFKASGQIRNYLAYAIADETLVGKFKTRSEYLNVSALMPENSGEELTASETEESSDLTAVDIPANIDFQMTSTFGKLIYDSIEMTNVKGDIIIKDQRIQMDNLYAELLDGSMDINGYYDSKDIEKPAVKMGLAIKDFDIQKAYSTFGMIKKYAPLAAKTKGTFSTSFNFNSLLDKEMMPVYETMNGQGTLKTSKINIKGLNTLDRIADAIKYEKIKEMAIDKINLSFKFVDGKILVDPFEFNQGNLKSTFGGWTAIDQQIEYVMALSLPRDELGSAANDVLNNLVNQANNKGAQFSLGEMVSLDVLIGGNLTNPTISTSLSNMGANLMEDLKTQVKEEIEKKKEEVSKEAKAKAQKLIDDADAQGRKLIQEAEKQAASIKKTANESAQKLRDEADKQAKNVEAEGKKKGPIAQIAANESAKKIRSEADKQANNLVAEANKQADGIINKANTEAANIKKTAQQEADKLLEVK